MAIHIPILTGGDITVGSGGSPTPPIPTPHADTWYKYANDTEWRTVSITGEIFGDADEGTPTAQIPNAANIVAIEIGTDVTRIGHCAFNYCADLTSITIPASVESIGELAFCDCDSITNVTIGDNVTSIGGEAFYDCSGLTSVTIGNSVTSIGSDAFAQCSGLTSVTIPDSVTSIGRAAFAWNYQLTSVTIIANGGNAETVKQMMINEIGDASIYDNITWNMPS